MFSAVGKMLLGGIGAAMPVKIPLNFNVAGNAFEEFAAEKICAVVDSFKSGEHSLFWREPQVKSGGEAKGGTECGSGPTRGGTRFRDAAGRKQKNSYPDFLVTPVPPDEIDKTKISTKSWLIAEVKLSVGNIRTSNRGKGKQFHRVLAHAQHYSISRLAGYLSFNSVGSRKEKNMKAIAARRKVWLEIVSVL